MIYVISDVHGNIEGLKQALFEHRITDVFGNRQLARKHKVISIGDLANCVASSVAGDNACLDLIDKVIDYMIIGNHEMGYFDPDNDFYGFHFDSVITHRLHSLKNEGKIIPAWLKDKTLISHAGISASLLSIEMNENEIFSVLWHEWEESNYKHSWFSSVGRSRGGRNHCGGVVWCDFHREFAPTDFPQIVGHSSAGGNVKMKDNALCIDVGAKDQNTKPFILEVR